MKMLSLLLLAVFLLIPASAQETTVIEPSPLLLEEIAELEAYTTEIRGLSPLEEVNRYFPQREEVEAFIAEQFAEEAVIQSLIDYEIIYKAFGLIDPEVDLLAVYNELLVSQIGGYYDPDTKRMNTLLISTDTLGDTLPLLEQIVYVHEFVHALQDQYYDLGTLLSDELALTDPDRATAIQALVEGDATQVMTEFLTVKMEDDPAEVMGQLEALTGMAATMEIPAGTPDILSDELLFPYTQGQVFVQALIAEGGYAAVDAAFQNPPVSTEHVIHPEKYLAGEQPIAVTVTDLSAALGEGWTLAYDRTAGEYFLRNWLKPGLSAFTLPIAASGWGGDRYHVYTDAEGQSAFQWRIVFDSAEDTEQFLEYLPDGLTYQFGDAVADGACWDVVDGGYALCYSAHAEGGVVITRAPSLEAAQALLGA